MSGRERAAVLWAEHIAKNTARERDDVAEKVVAHFNDAEFVELTAVCGLFAQSNRFQDSMCLPIEPQHEVDRIRTSVRTDPEKLKAYVLRMIEHWPSEFPAAAPTAPVEQDLTARYDIAVPRVPLLDSERGDDRGRYMAAARVLLGGATNAVRVWAHTPHVAKFFLALYFAFERDGLGSRLPAPLRLMVLLKSHHMHGANYLLAHHTLLGQTAGLNAGQLAALADPLAEQSPVFSASERAAIRWAARVARNNAKHDVAAFQELARYYDHASIVELTALCAIASNADLIYNALRIPVEPLAELQTLYSSITADPTRLKCYLEQIVADWPTDFPALDAGRG